MSVFIIYMRFSYRLLEDYRMYYRFHTTCYNQGDFYNKPLQHEDVLLFDQTKSYLDKN